MLSQNRQNGHSGAGHETKELRNGRGHHDRSGDRLQAAGLYDTEATPEGRLRLAQRWSHRPLNRSPKCAPLGSITYI